MSRVPVSPERVKKMQEKNNEITRNNMRIALTTIEEYFPRIIAETNDPNITGIRITSNKKRYLTEPYYLQNLVTYVATDLYNSEVLDNLELKLLLFCRVTDTNISYHPFDNNDYLLVTFEFPVNSTDPKEYFTIAIKCRVKNEYIYFD